MFLAGGAGDPKRPIVYATAALRKGRGYRATAVSAVQTAVALQHGRHSRGTCRLPDGAATIYNNIFPPSIHGTGNERPHCPQAFADVADRDYRGRGGGLVVGGSGRVALAALPVARPDRTALSGLRRRPRHP